MMGNDDSDGSTQVEASISKAIMAKDEELANDDVEFVAIQVGDRFKPNHGQDCPVAWHRKRNTHAFQNEFYPQRYLNNKGKPRNGSYLYNSTDIPWKCTGDGLRRISQTAALALEQSMHNGMFAFAETFIQPIMVMNNISIHWWDNRPFIKSLTKFNITKEKALDVLSNDTYFSNQTWAMYQRTFWEDIIAARRKKKEAKKKKKEENNKKKEENNKKNTERGGGSKTDEAAKTTTKKLLSEEEIITSNDNE